ncbi:hypothetical protein [Methylotuvimicrobium sp. KM2]|uniref:hypothetical protein n=1 Tax=Methylotuvimicrobium sp. KM2 TaxID=3133976 RepID=UPI003100F9A8
MIIQHRFYKCTALITLLIFMAFIPAEAALISDFTGPYSPANWTATTTAGNGSIDFNGFSSVTLTSSDQRDLGTQDQIDVDLTIMAAASGFVSFYWSYETFDIDGPQWDPFGYLHNDVFFLLTNDQGDFIQTGQTHFFVNAGDIFGFRQKTIDDQFGAGITTISQFSVQVPEPHISVLLSLGLACFLLTYSRRLKRS